MSTFKYTAGLNNVGSYQVSGIPYAIDPSSTTVTFPYVTSWVKIINDGSADRKVGFSANGVGGTNYFLVPATSSTEPLNLKLSELHLDSASDITIVAGLTSIPVQRINNLSGSGDIVGNNWSGSAGVG
jgi:hypothetical protein